MGFGFCGFAPGHVQGQQVDVQGILDGARPCCHRAARCLEFKPQQEDFVSTGIRV